MTLAYGSEGSYHGGMQKLWGVILFNNRTLLINLPVTISSAYYLRYITNA